MLANVSNLEIGCYAFEYCEQLQSFDIPSSVENLSIDRNVFANCTRLKDQVLTLHPVKRLRIYSNVGVRVELTGVSHLTINNSTYSNFNINISRDCNWILIDKDLKEELMKSIPEELKRKVLYYCLSVEDKSLILETSEESEKVKFTHMDLEGLDEDFIMEIKAINSRGKVISIDMDDDLKALFEEVQEETEDGVIIVYKKRD